MKQYRHIFFDLDKTIWDFDKSSEETFLDIYNKFFLADRGIANFHDLYKVYKHYNDLLWEHYRKGEILKEVLHVKRFLLTLNDFGIDDLPLAVAIAEEYITKLPFKNNVFPDTHTVLGYLQAKYKLHIVTNGFEEVQYKKMEFSDLIKYFTSIITSEDAGHKKPDPGIFYYAFAKTGALPEESIMVGDDMEVDILGAKNAGVDQVYVNYAQNTHEGEATYEVSSMKELMKLL